MIRKRRLANFTSMPDITRLRTNIECPVQRFRKLRKPRKRLSGKTPSPKEASRKTGGSVRTNKADSAKAKHLQDCNSLTPTQLRRKYELTYTTWRNMKQRSRATDALISPEFQDFSSFLRIMGPRPSAQFTLDRLNSENPVYGPGTCEWRDKKAQSNNRRNTTFLTASDGKCLPLAEWARINGQRPDTMRKRLARGWREDEVIKGVRIHTDVKTAGDKRLAALWPGIPAHGARVWEASYRRSWARSRYAWLKAEYDYFSAKFAEYDEKYAPLWPNQADPVIPVPEAKRIEAMRKFLRRAWVVLDNMRAQTERRRHEEFRAQMDGEPRRSYRDMGED